MQRRPVLWCFASAFGTVASFGAAPLARAQVKDLNDGINKAGRQRMLSQRLAKSWFALGQGASNETAEKVLATSMSLFDRQLVELKAFAPNAEVRGTYTQLESTWSDYKGALVGSAPARSGADRVLDLAGRVLAQANVGTMQLEALSGKPAGKLVNLCGRQRMLSQRMAAYYFSASWGVQAPAALAELNRARDEFLKAHAVLKAAPETTAAIRSELDIAQGQFTFFDSALRTLRSGGGESQALTNVFTTSERILQVMDELTGQFSKLA
jgi:Type IV pili methyl-accepting chemotaxis transducer N-term